MELIEVFKVQLSLTTSDAKQQVLIYNEDRSISWQGDASGDVKALMRGRAKAFFLGQHRKGDGKIELSLDEAPDPGW